MEITIQQVVTDQKVVDEAEAKWNAFKVNGKISLSHLDQKFEIVDFKICESLQAKSFLYLFYDGTHYDIATDLTCIREFPVFEIIATTNFDKFYQYELDAKIPIYKLDFDNFKIIETVFETIDDIYSSKDLGLETNISEGFKSKDALKKALDLS